MSIGNSIHFDFVGQFVKMLEVTNWRKVFMGKLNIYFCKDGRFEGRIYETDPETGTRSYRSFFGKTREEVEAKMLRYKSETVSIPSISLRFADLCIEWEQSIRFRIKESTAANYALKLDHHILPRFGDMLIGEITAADISGFVQEKQSSKLSNRYISDILLLMKSIFKYGMMHYHISNPMEAVCMPKKGETGDSGLPPSR